MKFAIEVEYTGAEPEDVMSKIKTALSKDYDINTDLTITRIRPFDLSGCYTWDEVKTNAHDASGITNPEYYLWYKAPNNIFYPIG